VIDVPPEASPAPVEPDLGELEHTRLRPSTPASAPPAPVALRLAFDTGERVDVTGDGLVGRSPAGEDGTVHVVPVDDPARSISKTHLAFGPDGAGGRLWVVDRGSTNGTVLVAPDGTVSALPAGTRATVAAGWTIRFGERSAVVERR
ncbi:FHA domain-containing protein, partial [Cellulomonas sp. ICMP 17802]|uniref:FHA domain-containing protein n=1 Tax=Cellulomonas sp. ICMP 17802 TaxID=3239199 RepID=UPI00351AF07A